MISKKVLFSVLLIGLIGVAAGAGTFAYFSDTEEADGVFMAGTIDIAVDGENPWSQTYEMLDMKPCKQVEDTNVEIENVGTNPALIFKKITVTDYGTGLELFECPDTGEMFSSEPEWSAETELVENGEGEMTRVINRVDDIHNVTQYWIEVDDLRISLACLLDLENDVATVGDVECNWMFLGELAPNETMAVNQYYKLAADAGNEYQGDHFNFTVTFMALQTNDDTTIPEYIDFTNIYEIGNWGEQQVNPINEMGIDLTGDKICVVVQAADKNGHYNGELEVQHAWGFGENAPVNQHTEWGWLNFNEGLAGFTLGVDGSGADLEIGESLEDLHHIVLLQIDGDVLSIENIQTRWIYLL